MYNNLPALTDNILWDDKLLAGSYSLLGKEAIETALLEYINAVNQLKGEWYPFKESPLSLWLSQYEQLTLYQPGLLSAERIIMSDVLDEAALMVQGLEMSTAIDQFVQVPDSDRLNEVRIMVTHFVRFIKQHFSLIQAGFIAFTPSMSVREEMHRKKQLLRDNASRHFLKSVMPDTVVQFYERSLKIQGIERVDEGGLFRAVSDKALPDEIHLELKDCTSPYSNGFIYQKVRPLKKNDDGTISVEITRGKHSSRKGYERWVQGAANRSIYFHYQGILSDLHQSRTLGASMVTGCQLQGRVLEKIDLAGQLSRRMLEVEVPFLHNLSVNDIFRIRNDYEDSVAAFRRSLRNCALEIEQAKNPDEIYQIQLRFGERIADEGLEDLRKKLRAWKRQSILDTSLMGVPAVLGFLGAPAYSTLATGAASLLQAALGAYRNHQEVTGHPSWFLLRLQEKKRTE